ncbi:MAG: hypothetical protein J8272_01085, partial ['Prunus persica' phytoplasma PP2]|nr:hypothetical protein ['Prunus persica' phytoplasma PP2]
PFLPHPNTPGCPQNTLHMTPLLSLSLSLSLSLLPQTLCAESRCSIVERGGGRVRGKGEWRKGQGGTHGMGKG